MRELDGRFCGKKLSLFTLCQCWSPPGEPSAGPRLFPPEVPFAKGTTAQPGPSRLATPASTPGAVVSSPIGILSQKSYIPPWPPFASSSTISERKRLQRTVIASRLSEISAATKLRWRLRGYSLVPAVRQAHLRLRQHDHAAADPLVQLVVAQAQLRSPQHDARVVLRSPRVVRARGRPDRRLRLDRARRRRELAADGAEAPAVRGGHRSESPASAESVLRFDCAPTRCRSDHPVGVSNLVLCRWDRVLKEQALGSRRRACISSAVFNHSMGGLAFSMVQ